MEIVMKVCSVIASMRYNQADDAQDLTRRDNANNSELESMMDVDFNGDHTTGDEESFESSHYKDDLDGLEVEEMAEDPELEFDELDDDGMSSVPLYSPLCLRYRH